MLAPRLVDIAIEEIHGTVCPGGEFSFPDGEL